ncbi:MAG: DUF3226 domain-containing protein [Nostocales cyanobacterium ELA583]|jgi:hypothetical protein
MNGLNPTKLKNALKDLKADIQKGEIERVGIIIDIDDQVEIDRINFVNECIQEVFPESQSLEEVKRFININFDVFNIQLACYFINLNGKGELETVLKEIKTQNSDYADCLETWKDCLNNHDKSISVKEFNKFWVSIYIRFDTCSKKEKKQAKRKCSFESAMSEKTWIWDFEHPTLNDLKEFLQMFC